LFRSILVPLDGSPFGEHALPLARTIAQASGATLHLAHVHVPRVRHAMTSESSIDASVEVEARTREQAYLRAVRARLGDEALLQLVPVLLDGPIADALAGYIATNDIDLVVMTTHGRGGLTRLWLGSTAYLLAHQITVAILLVRPEETAPDLTALRTFHRLLMPLDGSALAEQILEPALELARLMQAECTLLHIVEPLILPGYSPVGHVAALDVRANEALLHEAEQYMEMIAQRVQAEGISAHIEVVLDTQVGGAIVRAAAESAIDLIAIATHGRSGLARVLIGSVADKVVRASEIPVLVYRPTAERASAKP
jgi:nucleotide-binding universal stress UspA family protein